MKRPETGRVRTSRAERAKLRKARDNRPNSRALLPKGTSREAKERRALRTPRQAKSLAPEEGRRASAHPPRRKKGPMDERPAPKNIGVSYERALGEGPEAHEGAGGKIDSTQRNMGQTGEVM